MSGRAAASARDAVDGTKPSSSLCSSRIGRSQLVRPAHEVEAVEVDRLGEPGEEPGPTGSRSALSTPARTSAGSPSQSRLEVEGRRPSRRPATPARRRARQSASGDRVSGLQHGRAAHRPAHQHDVASRPVLEREAASPPRRRATRGRRARSGSRRCAGRRRRCGRRRAARCSPRRGTPAPPAASPVARTPGRARGSPSGRSAPARPGSARPGASPSGVATATSSYGKPSSRGLSRTSR